MVREKIIELLCESLKQSKAEAESQNDLTEIYLLSLESIPTEKEKVEIVTKGVNRYINGEHYVYGLGVSAR